ncbi:MAG: hypothetical protein J2P57_11345, partial [Acidimicrobiaceae bacterium]|nr:hypothetical protein [Acidimicrobiaceae bacterium]
MGLGSAFGRRTIVAASVVVALVSYGAVAATAATPTLIPPIAADWAAVGGASSPLGNPTTSTLTTPCGNGQYNSFQGGTIAYSPATGANAVYGVIGADYQHLGAMCGPIGLPLTNESPSRCVAGGRYNNFQNFGRITWTAATGAGETQGVIGATYGLMGAECSVLGLPLDNETGSACIAGARYNNFQNGRITWTGPTGAQETQGLINLKYMSLRA